MKKDQSVRKAEMKTAVIKQLKSLVVPVIILMVIIAAVFVIVFMKEEEEPIEIIKVSSYEGKETNLIMDNEYLTFSMDSMTTGFTVTVKSTGQTWHSNPPEASEDPIALSDEMDKLKSTLTLTYSTINGVDSLYSNYKYSIRNQIYDIETGQDYIKVYYSIGAVDKEYVIPTVITAERMESFVSEMTNTIANNVKDYYKKYDLDKLGKSDDKDALLEQYPILADGPIYVLYDGVKDNLKLKFESYFADAGYTDEDYLADMENDLSESTSDKLIFNISMVYRLDGKDLVVEVPMEEIEYKKDYPIISLSILPYFGAGGTDEDGYMLVPEGGGGIINFNNGKIAQNSYYANVYGWDMAQSRDYVVHETRTSFNAFGIANNNNSFLCMIEDGESYATINADISGKNNSYNYVNASYTILHREQYDVAAMYNGEMLVYEENIASEKLIQRYRFIDSEDYVDMARVYRDYLEEQYPDEWTANEDDSTPVAVEILGAVDKIKQVLGIPVSKPLALTTYQEAQKILEELKADGIKNLSVKLTGWMNGGIRQEILDDVSLISDLGSAKDLQSLLAYADEEGVTVYLDGITNYALNNRLLDGFNVYTDAARFVSKETVALTPYSTVDYTPETWKGEYYLLKPSLSIDMMSNLSAAADKYGTTGISFRDIGYELSADYNDKGVISREAVKEMQVSKLKELKESGYNITINRGNAYALPYADLVTNMDLKGSDYTIIDQQIPFLQIAIHNYVNYTGNSINLSQNYQEELLSSAEYGAGLSFTYMAEESTALQKTTYSQYFAVNYDSNSERMSEIYNRYESELGHTFNQTIEDHKIIDSLLTLTVYEDGTKVYVNYDYEEHTTEDGVIIPARDYLVIR